MVAVFTPGMRVLCRDAEWLVTRVESGSDLYDEQVVHRLGTDDLTRGHGAAFLTQLDRIENYKKAYGIFSESLGLANTKELS